jgi:hypothetical protein
MTMTMKPIDAAAHGFASAAGDLLLVALREMMEADPTAVAGMERLTSAGGLFTVRAVFAPSTGLGQIAIELASPAGEVCSVMSCELQADPLQ